MSEINWEELSDEYGKSLFSQFKLLCKSKFNKIDDKLLDEIETNYISSPNPQMLFEFVSNTIANDYPELQKEKERIMKMFEIIINKINHQYGYIEEIQEPKLEIKQKPRDLYISPPESKIRELKDTLNQERRKAIYDHARVTVKRDESIEEKTYIRLLTDLIAVVDSQNFTLTHTNQNN